MWKWATCVASEMACVNVQLSVVSFRNTADAGSSGRATRFQQGLPSLDVVSFIPQAAGPGRHCEHRIFFFVSPSLSTSFSLFSSLRTTGLQRRVRPCTKLSRTASLVHDPPHTRTHTPPCRHISDQCNARPLWCDVLLTHCAPRARRVLAFLW